MTDTRQKATKVKCKHDESITKQDAVVAYIWAWLYYAYVKFVMCMRNMWVVQVVAGFLQGVVFTGCW